MVRITGTGKSPVRGVTVVHVSGTCFTAIGFERLQCEELPVVDCELTLAIDERESSAGSCRAVRPGVEQGIQRIGIEHVR